MFLFLSELFLKIENTNIGGAFGLIRVSNKWRYAVIFSLIALRISLIRKIDSLSAIFSISKSSANFSNLGKSCFCFSSSYAALKSNLSFSII